jgi:hypothetical protein
MMSQPGTKATAKLIAQRFVWPGVWKDCHTLALASQPCQRSKVSRHNGDPNVMDAADIIDGTCPLHNDEPSFRY